MNHKSDSPQVSGERSTTRIGKIARLPQAVREQLNQRLQDGEQGQRLLAWLNALPAVQAVLQSDFASEPITKQNLSQWRRGGYRDWQVHREAMAEIQQLIGNAQEFRQTSSVPLSDMLALTLVARYIVAANKLKADDWQRLRELCADLVELRKGDHSAERLRLERERLDLEQKQLTKLREEDYRAWADAHRDEICRCYQSPEARMNKLSTLMFGEKPATSPLRSGPPDDEGGPTPARVDGSHPVAPSQTSDISQSSCAARKT